MLEFNADTPTSLLEAAVVQWQWKEDVFPANDQFNGIHEGLVASWKDIHKAYRCDQYFFASVSDFEEDNMTLKYLIATAIEAGLVTGEIDIEDIMHVNGTLYASPENPISCMFKLFPWETMFEQNPDACMTEMCWLEPAHNGWYPVIGSWVIGGEPAGIGIRETTSRITDNMSHFVPHIIL